jgi:trehalose-6-phosphate synthase
VRDCEFTCFLHCCQPWFIVITSHAAGTCRLKQITNPPRSSGKDVGELHAYVRDLVDRINRKYGKPVRGGGAPPVLAPPSAVAAAAAAAAAGGQPMEARAAAAAVAAATAAAAANGGACAGAGYLPVHYLERHVPLHERMAYYRCDNVTRAMLH